MRLAIRSDFCGNDMDRLVRNVSGHIDPMARGFRRLGGSWTVKNRDALERATE